MQVKDVMTRNCEYVMPEATLTEASRKMLEMDVGFLPIADPENDKLQGVITDRDIVLRAIAKGLSPEQTRVEHIETEQVLYCFEDVSLEDAAQSMHDQHVYRLVVVDRDKRLCGIISLGDIHRHNQNNLAAEAAEGITKAA